jgi:hypothetical protein
MYSNAFKFAASGYILPGTPGAKFWGRWNGYISGSSFVPQKRKENEYF